MTGNELFEKLESFYPKEIACSWDNVGFQIGKSDKEIKRIYVALDPTDEVINQALVCKADLLITHHPLIFSPRISITDGEFIGNRIIKMIQQDLSYYVLHTNYDILKMASLSGEMMNLKNPKVLDVLIDGETEEGFGRIGKLATPISLKECSEYVKRQFSLDSVKVFGDLNQSIENVAISPGSGSSMIDVSIKKQADVLITGDINHHDGIDAVAKGLTIIDAGHYGTEYIFIEDMVTFLKANFKEVEVIATPITHPFQMV